MSAEREHAADGPRQAQATRQVAVVLVKPRFAGSIGSCARSMAAFDCGDLRLVQPLTDHLCRKARGASAGAQDILKQATVHESIEDAVGMDNAVGFAAPNSPAAREADDIFDSARDAWTEWALSCRSGEKLCLVFGPENAGLTAKEARACEFGSCTIAHSPTAESLSLSHACTVALYDIWRSV